MSALGGALASQIGKEAGRNAGGAKKRKLTGTISEQQAAQLWVDAGGKKDEAGLAAAIAKHESGLVVGVVNSIGATGLWQIHPGGAQYKNAKTNARAAVGKRKGSKNKWGPNPWQVCNDAACSNLKAEGEKIQKEFEDGGGSNIPGPVGDAIDGAAKTAEVLKEYLNFQINLIKKLMDKQTWADAAKIAIGAILLIIALRRTIELA